MISHKECTHPSTSWERDKCRRSQGRYAPSQLERIESWRVVNPPKSPRAPSQPRYGHLADGEIRELTAEEIQAEYGKTVARFESCLRSYASSIGLKCSAAKTESGLRFRLWDEAAESELLDFLPADVAAQERAQMRVTNTTHRDCTHPDTGWEQTKCRERRKREAA